MYSGCVSIEIARYAPPNDLPSMFTGRKIDEIREIRVNETPGPTRLYTKPN